MSECRICGADNASLQTGNRGTLCPSCAMETPVKVSRDTFEREYWGPEFEKVHAGTRQSFWEDYRASSYTLAQYIAKTTREEGS